MKLSVEEANFRQSWTEHGASEEHKDHFLAWRISFGEQ